VSDRTALKGRDCDGRLPSTKHNVKASYLVVGVLEELNMSLVLLEHSLPGFFLDPWVRTRYVSCQLTGNFRGTVSTETSYLTDYKRLVFLIVI
jgi:hypothetical protein